MDRTTTGKIQIIIMIIYIYIYFLLIFFNLASKYQFVHVIPGLSAIGLLMKSIASSNNCITGGKKFRGKAMPAYFITKVGYCALVAFTITQIVNGSAACPSCVVHDECIFIQVMSSRASYDRTATVMSYPLWLRHAVHLTTGNDLSQTTVLLFDCQTDALHTATLCHSETTTSLRTREP